MEEWKDIKDYEGYYQISSYGRVKNIITGNIIKGDTNNFGYQRVCLYIPVKKRFFIHRLVALHFCSGYQDGLVVNHKDGDKSNNSANNLEWVTRSENDLHAYRLNLRKPHPNKFRHRIIAYDLATSNTIRIYDNVDDCCNDLKVARTNVYNCCNGKQKSCRGCGLKYEE